MTTFPATIPVNFRIAREINEKGGETKRTELEPLVEDVVVIYTAARSIVRMLISARRIVLR